MAIKIEGAAFKTSGVSLGITNLYIDVMVVFPHGQENAQARLRPYPMNDGQKGETALSQVDGVHDFSFSPSSLIVSDFWQDINAGNSHDYIISQLELEMPEWAGKITKIFPQ